MAFESASITKLLKRKKIQNDIHDSQNNKKLSQKKSDFVLERTTEYNLVRILAIIIGSVGLVVVIGWIFNITIFESLTPNSVTMKFSTAISFLMSSVILYLINESKCKNSELARVLLPAPIMIIMFYMSTLLISNLTGINTGIEKLFIIEKGGAQGSVLPGVPSIATMINFLLIIPASILSLIRYEKHDKETRIIGGIICGVGVTALLGYVANIPLLYYRINGFSSAMAIHTAMTFLLIGIAFMIYSKSNYSESSKVGTFVSIRIKILAIFIGIVPTMLLIYLLHSSESKNFLSTVIPEVVTMISFAIVASFFIAKFISTPISQRTKMVEEISEGKLGVEIEPRGNSELVKLTISINKMSRKLKEQNDDLQKTKEKFKTLYDKSPDLYRTISMDGIILDCNKSYAEHLGYSKEEIVGKPIFDHTAEKDLESIRDSFKTWKKNGNVTNREIWLRKKDGTTFPTLLNASAIYDENGNLLGSNTVIRDMTEIYKVKNEVLEQKEKRLSAIGELSARISHDLRNPLSVIKTSVSILRLRTGTSDERTQSDLVRIERAISRMTHQIDEVLDYVSPKPLNKENTTILKILSSAMERLNVPNAVKINLPKEDLKLNCEPEKIEIIFVNLITNAIQSMRNTGSIFIRTSLENNQIIIEVEDSGPGFRGDVLQRLFDPLFTTRQIGTGLGLVSCKRIIEQHGGTIVAKNSPDGGALFIIKIPVNV